MRHVITRWCGRPPRPEGGGTASSRGTTIASSRRRVTAKRDDGAVVLRDLGHHRLCGRRFLLVVESGDPDVCHHMVSTVVYRQPR